MSFRVRRDKYGNSTRHTIGKFYNVCVSNELQTKSIKGKDATLVVDDSLIIGGDLVVNGNFQLDQIQFETLQVSGTATFCDEVKLDTLKAKTDKITIDDSLCINGDLVVNGNFQLDQVQFETLQVSGTATFCNEVKLDTLKAKNEKITINDSLCINGDLVVNGNFQLDQVQFETLQVSGTATFCDEVKLDTLKAKTDKITIDDSLCINGNITAPNGEINRLSVDSLSSKSGSTICIDDTLQLDELERKNSPNLKIDGLLWPNSDGSVGQVITTDGNGNLTFQSVSASGSVSFIAIDVDEINSKSGSTICINDILQLDMINEKTTDASITIKTTGDGSVFINKVEMLNGSVGLSNEGAYTTLASDAQLDNTVLIEGRDYTFSSLTSRQKLESRHRDFSCLSEARQILASDGTAGDEFGTSCAVDGEFAVVGAPGYETSRGAAYILKRHPDGIWSQIQKIVASDSTFSDEFGSSVSISGNFIVVGAPLEDDLGSNSGAAYVFEARSDGTWQQVQKLKASDFLGDSINGRFGTSVSISGQTLIIGTPDANSSSYGAAYIFERNCEGNWIETQILQASSQVTNDQFGNSVSISGNFAIVGAENQGANDNGAAYIFEKDPVTGWPATETQLLTASDGAANDNFGSSVAIDGTRAVVGAPGFNSGVGKIYTFERNNSGIWIETQIITSIFGANSGFGNKISLNSNYFVAGSQTAAISKGAFAIYEKNNLGIWNLVILPIIGENTDDMFGSCVGLSENYLILGASGNDENGNDSGKAYIYEASLYEPVIRSDKIKVDSILSIEFVASKDINSTPHKTIISSFQLFGKAQWASRITGSGSEEGNGVFVSDNGDIAMTGYYTSASVLVYNSNNTVATILTNETVTLKDTFVTKYDCEGNNIWATRISGMLDESGTSICIDECDNTIVVGNFSSATINLFNANGSLSKTLTPGIVNPNSFLVQYDKNGNINWANYITSTKVETNSISINKYNNIAITGNGDSGIDFYDANEKFVGQIIVDASGTDFDAFIANYDQNGNVKWFVQIGGSNGSKFGKDVYLLDDGNNYTTGYYEQQIEFYNADGSSAKTFGDTMLPNAFLCKYSYDGKFIWASDIRGGGVNLGLFVSSNASKDVIVSGTYTSQITIYNADGSPFGVLDASTKSCYIIKYNSKGDVIWATRIVDDGGVTASGISVNDSDEIIVSVVVENSVNNTTIYNATGNIAASIDHSGLKTTIIARFDNNGQLKWRGRIDGMGEYVANDLHINRNGDIILAGFYSEDADIYDGNNSSNIQLDHFAVKDAFLIKYSEFQEMNLSSGSDNGASKVIYSDGAKAKIDGNFKDFNGNMKTKLFLRDGQSSELCWSSGKWLVGSTTGNIV